MEKLITNLQHTYCTRNSYYMSVMKPIREKDPDRCIYYLFSLWQIRKTIRSGTSPLQVSGVRMAEKRSRRRIDFKPHAEVSRTPLLRLNSPLFQVHSLDLDVDDDQPHISSSNRSSSNRSSRSSSSSSDSGSGSGSRAAATTTTTTALARAKKAAKTSPRNESGGGNKISDGRVA